MKNLNDMLQKATPLGSSEMNNLKGGDDHVTTKEEYCAQVRYILAHNKLSDAAMDGANYGLSVNGC